MNDTKEMLELIDSLRLALRDARLDRERLQRESEAMRGLAADRLQELERVRAANLALQDELGIANSQLEPGERPGYLKAQLATLERKAANTRDLWLQAMKDLQAMREARQGQQARAERAEARARKAEADLYATTAELGEARERLAEVVAYFEEVKEALDSGMQELVY